MIMEKAKAPAQPASVLIVDDHPAVREGLKAALRSSAGFQVVAEAADASQALSLLQTIHADIVVLDITLPVSNGIELAKAVRQTAPSAAIVAYTMHGEPAFMAAMKKVGVAAYVLKGEPLPVLLEALQMAREGRHRFPQLAGAAASFEPADRDEGTPPPHRSENGPADGNGGTENRVKLLSGREREIFLRLAQGNSVKQAAFDLGLSPKTVETYKYRLMRKLATDNVVELAKLAIREHLVQP